MGLNPVEIHRFSFGLHATSAARLPLFIIRASKYLTYSTYTYDDMYIPQCSHYEYHAADLKQSAVLATV